MGAWVHGVGPLMHFYDAVSATVRIFKAPVRCIDFLGHGCIDSWVHGVGFYNSRKAPIGRPKGALRAPVGFSQRSFLNGLLGSRLHCFNGTFVHGRLHYRLMVLFVQSASRAP